MNVQEVIVGVVMLVCLAWVVRRTIHCFKRIRQKDNPCEGCPCDCSMKGKTCFDEKK